MTTTPSTIPAEQSVSTTRLTEAQEGLWFAQRLDPDNPVFNTGQYVELEGSLDIDRFRRAVDRAVREASALTILIEERDGAPVQVCAGDPSPALRVVDMRQAGSPREEALHQIDADMATALDLARDPLVAEWLFVIGETRFLWYQRVHHVAIDGYGTAMLTRRIADLYNAASAEEAGAPFAPYVGLLAADADYRVSARRDRDREFWLQQFGDRPAVAVLAPGAATTARTYRRRAVELPAAAAASLHRVADAAASPWPDVLVAAVAGYVQRHVRSADVVLGVATMDRMGTPAARVPAMVMNVLPVRIAVDEDRPFAEVVADASRALRLARRHGRYRSEQLRRDLGLVGGTRRLFGPLVNVLPFDEAPSFAGLVATLHILGTGPVDDMTIAFRAGPAGQGLRLELDGNPNLYSEADMAAHALRLSAFVAATLETERLASVPTLTVAEQVAANDAPNLTMHDVEDTTLWALIERTIVRRGDATAVLFEGQALTYRDLDDRTATLVARLRTEGVRRGDLVVVSLPRSLDLVVALVAVLRAGAAYLPIETDHPRERVAVILASAQPRAVLTLAELADRFATASAVITLAGEGVPHEGADGPRDDSTPSLDDAADDTPGPDDAAYVIYTSGSTGTPKGVVIDHRAIVNRLEWMRHHYAIDESDRILQKTPATFDVSVWEFFLPLITGATLVVAPPEAHKDPAWLAGILRRDRITTAHFVPSMLAVFLSEPAAAGLVMRRVFCSGEALPASLRDRFHEVVVAELHNLYGPTEAAVDVTFWEASRDDRSSPVPIGWPVWNTQMYVLDERLRPVPPGVPGDLYIAGVQLAREYLGRPDLTAERFIPCPFDPSDRRMYRTGDLAERRADGAIVFLGREDDQIKIRGLRVELGEIETAAMRSGLVSAVAVVAREDRPGEQRLVGYVVPSAAHLDLDKLRSHLATQVPDYMVPSAFVVLDALPLSANGKLQRSALPAPVASRAAVVRPPESPTEARVADLFVEILGPTASAGDAPVKIGRDQDFFELGGDSLRAAVLMQRVRREWSCELGLGVLFAHPTVARLAAQIDATVTAASSALRPDTGDEQGLGVLIQVAGDRGSAIAPLVCIHPAGGISWCYAGLGRALEQRRPLLGVQARGLDPRSPVPPRLEDMAAEYVTVVRRAWPEGPYHLLGWSVGGIIAHEMAAQLRDAGTQVGTLAMLDTYPSDHWRNEPEPDEHASLRALLLMAGQDPDAFASAWTREAVIAFLRASGHPLGTFSSEVLTGVMRVVSHNSRLVREHRHRRFDGSLLFFAAGLDHVGQDFSSDEWRPYISGTIHRHEVASLHAHMTGPDAVRRIAPVLERWWADVETTRA